MRLRLTRHPDFPCAAVTEITVDVARLHRSVLQLTYFVSGDIGAIRMPVATQAARADELWKHTCFEAFVADGDGYFEFNLAPSTQWAVYHFNAYRAGMTITDVAAPSIETRREDERFELHTAIALPERSGRLGLSAVIEESNGEKSYWALAHAPGRPDFHHADTFAADVPPAEQT